MSLLFRSTFLSVGLAFSLFLVVAKISANDMQKVPTIIEKLSSIKMSAQNSQSPNLKDGGFQDIDQRRAQLIAQQEKRLQNDNLEEFRKQQLREYELKKQDVLTKRKQCMETVKTYMNDRKTMRETLRKSCLPSKSVPMPNTAEEATQFRSALKEQQKTCDLRVKNFDTDTRVQSVTIRKSCFEMERSVLGLSTEVPSQIAQ